MNKIVCFALLLGVLLLATLIKTESGSTVTALNVPEEVYVLKVVDQKISKDRAQQIAERIIGIEGEVVDRGNAWSIKNGTKEVTVYKYGAVKYLDDEKVWGEGYREDEMPSERDAKLKAQKFVNVLINESLIDKELLQQDIILAMKLEKDVRVIAYRNGTIQKYVSNVHVNVPLSFNGIPLHGAGGKLRVYLTKGNEVVGLLSFVGKIEPDKKVQVLSPEEAIERLKKMGYGNSKIESVQFVYDVPSPDEMPKSIIPVYIFKGTIFAKDGSSLKFVRIVPAVKNQ